MKMIRDHSNEYEYKEASNVAMNILGNFLSRDIRSYNISSFKGWALYDKGDVYGGNLTNLEKDDEKVYLTAGYSEEEVPTRVEMTIHQFVKLLEEWEEKVFKKCPAEVVIIYQNGEFTIETDNSSEMK